MDIPKSSRNLNDAQRKTIADLPDGGFDHRKLVADANKSAPNSTKLDQSVDFSQTSNERLKRCFFGFSFLAFLFLSYVCMLRLNGAESQGDPYRGPNLGPTPDPMFPRLSKLGNP